VSVTTSSECAWSASASVSWITGLNPVSGQGQGQVQFQVAPNASGTARQGDISLNGVAARVSQMGASCTVTLTPPSQNVAAGTATGAVAVGAPTGCAWTATSNDGWITITSGATGSGGGSVNFAVSANSGAARVGGIAIAGQTFAITQGSPTTPSCAPSISSTSQSIGAAGGAGAAVSVTAAASCAWTAASNASWLTITAGASGAGNGQVRFSATANSGGARVGTLTIAGFTFTVDQAGSCASSISPASQSIAGTGGAGTPIAVTAPAGCGWTATTAATWITITSGASGNGSGTVDFTAAPNTGATRTGTISVAGQTHTVTQSSPCTYSINATSQTLNKNAQKGKDIAVSTSATCAWTATSNDSWITITSAASDSGNGTVKWTVSQNNTNNTRIGTMTIAGQTFTVTQTKN
jgi:hypothetical protein